MHPIANGTRRCMRIRRGRWPRQRPGLHFTREILEEIRKRGCETCEITLHVGLGTFRPIHSETLEEHKIHSETYEICEEAAEKIRFAKKAGAARYSRWEPQWCARWKTLRQPRRRMFRRRECLPRRAEASHFYHPRLHVSRCGHATDKFPFAEIDASGAGLRFCRTKIFCGLSACRRGAIPILQLWRLHVDSLRGGFKDLSHRKREGSGDCCQLPSDSVSVTVGFYPTAPERKRFSCRQNEVRPSCRRR